MIVLAPELTALDERVLRALPDRRPGVREREVWRDVQPRKYSGGQAVPVRDVREILRGLERVGRAECRGGWWARP